MSATPLTKPDALPSELQRLLDDIDACERAAEALAAALSEEELNWQERPGETWSVRQCLDHLASTNPFYLAGFISRVEAARVKSAGAFRGLQPCEVAEPVVPRSNVGREGLVEAFKRSRPC